MKRYVFQRFGEMLVTLILMSAIVFLLGRLSGDPVARLLGDFATIEDRDRIMQDLGFDRPIVEQYVIFASRAVRGDFGASVMGDHRPALAMIAERLPASLQLAVAALAISLVIGIPLGVLAAVKRGTAYDLIARLFALIGQSAPVFWLGIVLMYIFAVQLRLLPTSGYGGPIYFVLPATTMGLFSVAAVTRLVRTSMIEALQAEYIKLARIKGLTETRVIWKHALRNSLIPILTYMGAFFGAMITGAVVVETIFSWPGIGRLAYESVIGRDFPVMQAVVLVITSIFILANLAVDIAYAWLDPRIKYDKS